MNNPVFLIDLPKQMFQRQAIHWVIINSKGKQCDEELQLDHFSNTLKLNRNETEKIYESIKWKKEKKTSLVSKHCSVSTYLPVSRGLMRELRHWVYECGSLRGLNNVFAKHCLEVTLGKDMELRIIVKWIFASSSIDFSRLQLYISTNSSPVAIRHILKLKSFVYDISFQTQIRILHLDESFLKKGQNNK